MKISIPDMIVGYCVGLLCASLMIASKINKSTKKVSNLLNVFDDKCDQLEQKNGGQL